MKRTTAQDQPWIDNYPPLKSWLSEKGARCDWQIPLGDKSLAGYVEQWTAPGAKVPFIIIVRPLRLGWDIFSPAQSHEVAATLRDAEERIFGDSKGQ